MRNTFNTGLSMPLVARSRKPAKVRLALELEGPRHRPEQVDLVEVGELVGAGNLRGGVARIHRAVAVRVLWIRRHGAGRTAFRIRFADHDRDALQLWKRGGNLETVGDRAQLVVDAHPDVTVHDARRALGVKRHEIERRAGLAGRVVRAAQTMLDEARQDALGALAVRTGDMRAADARGRQRALQAVGRVVVQLLELFGRAAPVTDVRLVPDLPIPALDFVASRTVRPSASPTDDQLAPISHSPWADRSSRCRCGRTARPGFQSCSYGSGFVDSASGMKPISTSGFILRST